MLRGGPAWRPRIGDEFREDIKEIRASLQQIETTLTNERLTVKEHGVQIGTLQKLLGGVATLVGGLIVGALKSALHL